MHARHRSIGRFGVLGVAAAGLTAPASFAQTVATHASGSGNWSDPLQWSPAVAPINGAPTPLDTYHAVISGGFVTLDVDPTVAAFTLGSGPATLGVDTAGPTHTRTLTVDGLFTWSGGSLQGGLSGGAWNTGILDADGGILLDNAASVALSHWTIHNAGTTRVTGAGSVGFGADATFQNAATGVVDFESDADFTLSSSTARLLNQGTIRKTGGAGISQIGIAIEQSAGGAIHAASGTLRLAFGSFGGALSASGATLEQFNFGSSPVSFHDTAFAATAGGLVVVRNDATYHGTITGTGDGTGTIALAGDIQVDAGETAILDFAADTPVIFNTVNTEGTLFNDGSARWGSFSIEGAGMTNRGHLEIGQALRKDVGSLDDASTLVNAVGGTITQTGAFLYLNQTSTLENHGVYDIQIDSAQLIQASNGVASPSIVNTGTFQKSAGAGISEVRQDVAFASTGTIRSTSGTLLIANATNLSGTIEADGGAVDLRGDNLTIIDLAFDVRDGGQVQFTHAVGSSPNQVSGTLTSTGDGTGEVRLVATDAAGGTVFNLSEQAPLVLVGDDLESPGFVYNDGAMELRTGRIIVGDGSDNDAHTTPRFYNRGRLLVTGGSFGNSSHATTFDNFGGTVVQTGHAFVESASTLLNRHDGRGGQGVWDLQGDTVLNDFSEGEARFLNEGLFKKSAGIGFSSIMQPFVNQAGGVVRVETGTLIFNEFTQTGDDSRVELAGGKFAVQPFGGSLIITGGTVTGSGDIGGTLAHDGGVLAPGNSAGLIQILDGHYQQAADATLAIELGGTTAGDTFDQLVVDLVRGFAATLGGTIEISLIGGFTPTTGQTFDILLAGAIIDDGYALTVATPLPGGLWFEESIEDIGGSEALRLTVVPEPATLTLLTLSAFALRRRR